MSAADWVKESVDTHRLNSPDNRFMASYGLGEWKTMNLDAADTAQLQLRQNIQANA